jgi:cbb3-type cytochrome oxidase maturation protein
MNIIILLILISLTIAIVFLLIFYWSMKSGQYDDTYTPSVRMLFEDKKKERKTPEKVERDQSTQKAKV